MNSMLGHWITRYVLKFVFFKKAVLDKSNLHL